MNIIVARTFRILEDDSTVAHLVDGFRRLNKISAKGEGIYLNVHPRREQKGAVMTGDSSGLEVWRYDIWVDVGYFIYRSDDTKNPDELVANIISGAGAVWDAIQGSFLPDSSGTAFLTVPLRHEQTDYDDDFLVTEDGGIMWETKAIFSGHKKINNP